MPPPNGNSATASQAARVRRVPIVPAIPLALSKPKAKPARPQTKAETSSTPTVQKEVLVEDVVIGVKEEETPKAAHVGVDLEATTHSELLTNGHVDEALEHAKSSVETPVSVESVNLVPAANGMIPGNVTVDDTAGQATAVLDAPIDAASPTVMPSPSPSRRDRFDIRQIRTELPPAFVPFVDQQTPRSAHSAASSQGRPYHQLPHAHPIHPSASSIVFGGHDSSTSSPAPPLSAGSAFAPPQFPLQPPGLSSVHPISEPQGQRMHQPPYPQPPIQWAMRPYGASGPPPPPGYHPHAHMPHRYPPRDSFASVAPLPNGLGARSRSGSHASSGPQDGHRPGNDVRSPVNSEQADIARASAFEHRTAAFYPQHRPFPSQQVPPPPPTFPPPDIASAMENAGTMRDHVLSQFLNSEFADCQLQVVEAAGGGRAYIDGHKLILARSQTLLSYIRTSEPPETASTKQQVKVELKGQYIRLGPFSECVRYLYGGPLPRFDFYRSLETNTDRMQFALGFIATGAWLGVPAIAHQSVEIATSFLQWDTYAAALAFALDGGLDPAWPIGDGSEERVSTCSSDDSFSKPEAGGAPTYEPYSTGLLHRIIEFTVHNFPSNFYLDQTAPQMVLCPRLPAFKMKHESKLSRSDPRLSKIRFGEVPIEDHQRPSPITTTISSILLSLPFPLLKYLLEHPLLSNRLGSETVGSIMRQVVHEREVRRQKALQSRTIDNEDHATADVQKVQNLYWEESVEQSAQHRAGFRLARRRRGIDTPPSSGAESERTQ